jgi:hypothetical protein
MNSEVLVVWGCLSAATLLAKRRVKSTICGAFKQVDTP